MIRPINKKGFEMSFSWLFALIAGAFILMLAIFIASKIISQGEGKSDAITAKEIQILLNPLETSFQEGVVTSFNLNVDSRIYNYCIIDGEFGRQIIKVSQKSFDKWTKEGVEVGSSNNYIFSKSPSEGREFLLFVKPFKMPFKVADLIYLIPSSENYCFRNTGEEIKDEIENLGIKNIFLEISDCPEDSINVCFGSGDCEIYVKESQGIVEKDGEVLSFSDDATMYAAIFSSKEVYECQVKRLMMRLEKLADIYREKAIIMDSKGCHSGIGSELVMLKSLAETYQDSTQLGSVYDLANRIEEKVYDSSCKLW